MIRCNMPADILSKHAKDTFLSNIVLCNLTKSLMNRLYSFFKDVQYALDVNEDTVYLYVITNSHDKEDDQLIVDNVLEMYRDFYQYIGYKINVILTKSYSGIN